MYTTCQVCQKEFTVRENDADTVICPVCASNSVQSSAAGDPQAGNSEMEETCEAPSHIFSTEEPEVPASIGRYRVQRRLARGGFGFVYLAHDTLLGRRVALKVSRAADSGTEPNRQASIDEARATARLQHEGIVTIYDVGELPDKRLYIVMEYVDGKSIAELFGGQPIAPRRAAALVCELAKAVHYAHKESVFHRDIKPANILMDSDGRPKITDFGLAILEENQRKHRAEVAGTIPYMAPEQVRGEVHRMDGRADQWALGVLLYELLLGRRPFGGAVPQLKDEILHRHPRPPRQIDDSLPRELEQICLTCLAKDPSARYPTCMDLADNLSSWLNESRAPNLATATDSKANRGNRWVWLLPLVVVGVWGAIRFGIVPDNVWDVGATSKQSLVAERVFDEHSSPGKLYHLLSSVPEKTLWPPSPQARTYAEPEREEVSIRAPNTALLELGETVQPNFSFRVEMSKVAWTGSAGLFWDLEREIQGSRELIRFKSVSLVYLGEDSHEGPYRLQKTERVMVYDRTHATLVRDDVQSKVKVSLPVSEVISGASRDLRIELRGGRVTTVSWGGKSYWELVDRSGDERPKQSRAFGVLTGTGETVFGKATFLFEEVSNE